MRRIKLNSRVSFPQVLNLNRFLSTYTPPAEGENDAEEHDDTEDEPEEGHDDNQSGATSNKTKSTGDIEGNSSTSDPAPETGDSSESKGEDEDEDTKAKKEQINSVEASDKPKPKSKSRLHREKQIAAALKEGPYVYELYAILIHRGSALGGHYYAYIKQLDDDEWFEFNDSSVSNIDEKTIADAYGEDNARWGSGSNAYMLCYRRVDATRNMKIIAKEDIPSDVKAIVLEEEKEKLERNKQLERERAMVKFKLHYAHQTKGIKIHRGQTLNDVVVAAQKAFGLEETVAIEDLRLRGWSTYNDVPTDPLPDVRFPLTY
jgi:ubiquitin carboxyl-terminal hydrolase 47